MLECLAVATEGIDLKARELIDVGASSIHAGRVGSLLIPRSSLRRAVSWDADVSEELDGIRDPADTTRLLELGRGRIRIVLHEEAGSIEPRRSGV